MPFTHVTFLIGTLALVGIPPLAGFWSKDAILASALAEVVRSAGRSTSAASLGAFLTGMYALRLYFAVFRGAPVGARAPRKRTHTTARRPRSMTVPVGVLALGSPVAGLLLIPGVWHPFDAWLERAVEPLVRPTTGEEWATSGLAVAFGVLGGFARMASVRAPVASSSPTGGVRRTLEHKLWFDEVYDAVFSRPAQALAVAAAGPVRGACRPGRARRGGRGGAARRSGHVERAERPAAHLRPRDHRRRRSS